MIVDLDKDKIICPYCDNTWFKLQDVYEASKPQYNNKNGEQIILKNKRQMLVCTKCGKSPAESVQISNGVYKLVYND